MLLPDNLYYTDEMLLRAFQEGNEQAFKTIYDKHYEQVLAMALRYTRQISEAQDVATDAFIKLWNERQMLSTISEARAFFICECEIQMY